MVHAVQQSLDNTHMFAGVIVHDGTTDQHGHIFGGVNWANNTRFGVWPPRGGPRPAPGYAALGAIMMVHVLPPHAGERPGGNLGIMNVVARAPLVGAGNRNVFGLAARQRPHATHKDYLLGLVFGVANGGRIRQSGGILLAAHEVPERQFLLVSDGVAQEGAKAGGAAVALDMEAGIGCLALGLLETGAAAKRSVTIGSGAHSIEVTLDKDDIDVLEDVGFAALVEFEFDPGAVDPEAEHGITVDLGRKQSWSAVMIPADAVEGASAVKAECRPGSVKATKWGAWKATEREAAKSAFKTARKTADEACHGSCQDGACKYTEAATELLETEDRMHNGQKQYRSKVKTEGKCECQ